MHEQTKLLIDAALKEDIGSGDATTLALVPPHAPARAVITARHPCRIAGSSIARQVFQTVDPDLSVVTNVADGRNACSGQAIMSLNGRAASILTAERTALNFLQRLTGIATLCTECVKRAAPHGVVILDTRKTTPGWRTMEKHAVRCGGGMNHRMGLYDRIMIKDNHRRFWAGEQKRSLADAVRQARKRFPALTVEVEVENTDELREALKAHPEWILLDNMNITQVKECVAINSGASRLEVSGNVTVAEIGAFAATGVDAISLGCLTHSAPAADLSLEFAE